MDNTQQIMRNTYLVIDTHSFVDVITNSSTELFVCDTDKSTNTIGEILRDRLQAYNLLYNREFNYDDCFETPFVYTQEMYDKADEVLEYRWGYEHSGNIGKTIITSTSDNSIPYDLWEIIEDLFNADRHHLG